VCDSFLKHSTNDKIKQSKILAVSTRVTSVNKIIYISCYLYLNLYVKEEMFPKLFQIDIFETFLIRKILSYSDNDCSCVVFIELLSILIEYN
jgi:hypothetical protein